MGQTIHDIRRTLYFKLKASGSNDEDIFKKYPFMRESVEMGAFHAHFGSWKLIITTTIIMLVLFFGLFLIPIGYK